MQSHQSFILNYPSNPTCIIYNHAYNAIIPIILSVQSVSLEKSCLWSNYYNHCYQSNKSNLSNKSIIHLIKLVQSIDELFKTIIKWLSASNSWSVIIHPSPSHHTISAIIHLSKPWYQTNTILCSIVQTFKSVP